MIFERGSEANQRGIRGHGLGDLWLIELSSMSWILPVILAQLMIHTHNKNTHNSCIDIVWGKGNNQLIQKYSSRNKNVSIHHNLFSSSPCLYMCVFLYLHLCMYNVMCMCVCVSLCGFVMTYFWENFCVFISTTHLRYARISPVQITIPVKFSSNFGHVWYSQCVFQKISLCSQSKTNGMYRKLSWFNSGSK